MHPLVDELVHAQRPELAAEAAALDHRSGLERVVQAGAQPIGWVSLACELDWARMETVPDVVDIVLTTRLLAHA